MAIRITNQKLSKSSRAWMREHLDDPFVKKAQKEGYRARAAYKLLEIQEKYKMIKPGMTVVDLGAAPGSWSQIAGKLVGSNGLVIASDILEMDALPDVTFLQGDFREEEVFEKLLNILNGRQVDVVISDMAPIHQVIGLLINHVKFICVNWLWTLLKKCLDRMGSLWLKCSKVLALMSLESKWSIVLMC